MERELVEGLLKVIFVRVRFLLPLVVLWLWLIVRRFVFEIELSKIGRKRSMSIRFDHGKLAYGVINDADDQATAGTGRDVLIICKLRPRDLETITTRAGIVVDALCVVPAHILDFDLVVVCAHRERQI